MSAFIRVDRLSLDVPVFLQRERQAKGWAGVFLGAAFDPPRRRLVRLLDDLSFEIREGDRVAILGRNGAGKSTLLRVLNRVYQPSQGSVTVEGSCQALLNMSLGFNSEATVRENIHLRGIAMGLKSSFLREQIGPILEFSGLGEKANHRLRTLSSGQKMRLGFAISTCVQHDIILMDEWVGAGDADFMAKAKERMRSRVGGSKIVVLASHSVGLLRDICNKGLVIDRGRLLYQGDIVSALKSYNDLLARLRSEPGAGPVEPQDAGAMTYGCVEAIEVRDGAVHLRGWCVNSDGTLPQGLVLLAGGLRHVPSRIDRHAREDVARHMGLSDSGCGFHAVFEDLGAEDIEALDADFEVLGGTTTDAAHAALRIAPAVSLAVRPSPPPPRAA